MASSGHDFDIYENEKVGIFLRTEALALLAEAFRRAGAYEEALETGERAIRDSPEMGRDLVEL